MSIFDKTYFFGWTNFKWLVTELAAMYSNRKSYFSKKRLESSVAFMSAVGLIVWHVLSHEDSISNSEVLADAVVLFGIAGYTVNQIQKEKQCPSIPNDTPDKDEPKKVITENKKAVKPPTEDYSADEDAV